MKKRRLLLIALFLLLIPAGVLVISPYPRQLVFGPRIQGVPLCAWQEKFRRELDLGEQKPSVITTLLDWLKGGQRSPDWASDWGSLSYNQTKLILFSLADDTCARVRRIVASELAVHEPADAPADVISVLLRLMDDSDDEVFEMALQSFWHLRRSAPEGRERIGILLTHLNSYRRLQAAKLVSSAFWSDDDRGLKHLVLLLRDTSPEVRMIAITELDSSAWSRPNAQIAIRELIAHLQDSDPGCRHAAGNSVWMMYCHRHLGIHSSFIEELKDPDAKIRDQAFIFARFVVEWTWKGYPGDATRHIRKEIIQALADLGEQARLAIPSLVSVLNDDDANTVAAAAEALAKIDPARFAKKKSSP